MGILDTALGDYVKRVARLTENKVKRGAYDDSVLRQMADLNNQQLTDGFYSDGTYTPNYAVYTIELKKIEGKIWEHMTFDDTGKTRKSIRYIYRSGKLQVLINDRFDLLNEYSENIIGLTSNSISDVQDEILENIQKQFLP